METPAFVERSEAGSVFSLLSDENRIAILRALWEQQEPMSFSTLYDAVSIDDSGQFNYHLDKLRGQFVVRDEDGYTLTAAGRRINGAIDAGSYTTKGSMEPISLDPPCATCGGDQTLYYEDEQLRVECGNCDVTAVFVIPPSSFVGRSREEIPRVASRYLQTMLYHIGNGFCTFCEGHIEKSVTSLGSELSTGSTGRESPAVENPEETPVVQYECRQCGKQPSGGLAVSLLSHPAVVSFYYQHGIDIRNRSIWEFISFDTEQASIHSHDPFRAETTFQVDGDELTVVVDENLETIEIQ